MMLKISDAPPEVRATPGAENHVMHARLQVGDRLLMGGDAPSHIPLLAADRLLFEHHGR